ncbi:MAG: hypothetical protein QM783_10385 [Phycisphaerales bacterium]
MGFDLIHLAIPLGIIAALLIAVEAGHLAGKRRVQTSPGEHKTDTGAIQGAMLGLLGLLLGFSFAGASRGSSNART